jgi:hypothetical protein
MDLRPSLNESLLPSREVPSNEIYGFDIEDPHAVLIVRMKMRAMMRSTRFCKHPNNDAKKTAYFWHYSLHDLFRFDSADKP